jgi:hypothetical protein
MSTIDNIGAGDMVNRTTGQTSGGNTSGGSAGLNKLWLPLWSGEVIHAYDQVNMFESMITNKPLTGGYSYEFPITGTVQAAAAWNAGEELGGGTSKTNTFKVVLDKRPMATYFECDNIDSLITQWDYRSELARQAGLQLANMRDKQIALSILAACSVAPIGADDPRGSLTFPQPVEVGALDVLASACTETAALNILKAIEDYFVTMQENDYTVGNVYCVVTPKVFQVIRGLGLTRATDVTGTLSGNTGTNFTKLPMFGGVADQGGLGAPYTMGMNSMGDSLDYMGCKIVKSNHLPATTADNANLALGSLKYNLCTAGFSTYGMIFQPEAVAGLSLQGLKVDSIADVRRNTQFTVASMMKGTGILRPELCQALLAPVTSTGVSAAGHVNTRGEVAAILDNGTNGWATGFAAEYAATSG